MLGLTSTFQALTFSRLPQSSLLRHSATGEHQLAAQGKASCNSGMVPTLGLAFGRRLRGDLDHIGGLVGLQLSVGR